MLKRIAGPFVVMTLSVAFALPTQARAEVQYPWCAQYGGHDYEGTNCGFVTLEQCRATISGIGGYCYENPAYPATTARPKKPVRR